jgi:hypothetical protein
LAGVYSLLLWNFEHLFFAVAQKKAGEPLFGSPAIRIFDQLLLPSSSMATTQGQKTGGAQKSD